MPWTGINSVNALTGAAGPSFTIPELYHSGWPDAADPIMIGASAKSLYLMGPVQIGSEGQGVTWFRTPIDGSGPWDPYLTDTDYNLTGAWGSFSGPDGSQSWALANTTYPSVLPLANCGVDPLTDTLWVAEYVPGDRQPGLFWLIRIKDGQAPDLTLQVNDLSLDQTMTQPPFWVLGPQAIIPPLPDGWGSEDQPTEIIFLTDPPLHLPLPTLPEGESQWLQYRLQLTQLGPTRFLLLKTSDANVEQVLVWTYDWVNDNGWTRQANLTQTIDQQNFSYQPQLGTGPNNQPWNMLSLTSNQAGFLGGGPIDGTLLPSSFATVNEATSYLGGPVVSADFPGTPVKLGDVASLMQAAGWFIPPLQPVADGSLLLTGYNQTDPMLLPARHMLVTINDVVDAVLANHMYMVDTDTGRPAQVDVLRTFTYLPDFTYPGNLAFDGAVLSGVGPNGVFAAGRVADTTIQNALDTVLVLALSTQSTWDVSFNLSTALAAHPELSSYTIINHGPEFRVDGSGGLWLLLTMVTDDSYANEVGLVWHCPAGGSWSLVWNQLSSVSTYAIGNLRFGGAMKTLPFFYDGSWHVWNGSGWSTIPDLSITLPGQNGLYTSSGPYNGVTLYLVSPTEAWAYRRQFVALGPGFTHFVDGSWSQPIALDGGVGFKCDDDTLWAVDQGALLFGSFRVDDQTYAGGGAIFVPGSTPTLIPALIGTGGADSRVTFEGELVPVMNPGWGYMQSGSVNHVNDVTETSDHTIIVAIDAEG